MTMVSAPLRVVPELPEGWLPEPALILAFAKPAAESCEAWEVVLPEYAIVARGDSFHESMDEAIELLEDYWRMCASEGLSYEESRRPISNRWFSSLVLQALMSGVASRLRDHAQRRLKVLRFPVESGSPHLAV